MPEASHPGDRTPAKRGTDHASLARLSDTLVPALVAKLNASGLGELEVREGDWRIRLRRPLAGMPATPPVRRPDRPRLAQHVPDREPRGSRESSASDPAGSIAPEVAEHRSIATSPAVGVFRPDLAPGARLRAGDRIGIVDLLGIPQDVVAPVDGTIVDVLVTAGEAVEYGEAIAVIEAEPVDPPAPATADGEG